MHIFNFLLFYPIFMSIYWIVGSIYYFFIKEKPFNRLLLVKSEHQQVEGISFLLACYNESETVQDTLSSVLSLEYPEKEIIIINDGSSDNTAEIIYEFKKNHDFKFVDLEVNRGKANALNEGIKQASYEYVMCLDADTVIDDDAPFYMIEDFKKNPKLGAVTGNPRIRNKSSILGKIQTIEYASIIGCIKRSQSLAGAINTISGVFTLFKKKCTQRCRLLGY